jgi:hypothetical protein
VTKLAHDPALRSVVDRTGLDRPAVARHMSVTGG